MESARKSKGARQSINARVSNMFGARHVSDQRPVTNKDFQNNCIRRIIEYFQSKKSDFVITPKQLQNPSAKDFSSILLALVKQIDESYEFTQKIEDEVPALFKSLGYPFTLGKSSLLAVGAPNSWPAVLAALTWLLDLVLYLEKSNDEEEDFYNREQSENELYAEHLMRCYELFLTGQDYSDELSDLRFQLEKRVQEVSMQTNKMKELIVTLRQEKEGLKISERNPKLLDEQIKLLEQELESLSNMDNILKTQDQLESQLNYLKDENESWRLTLESKINDLEVLKLRINAQELSLEDKNRIQQAAVFVDQAIKDVKKERDQLNQIHWEMQQKLQQQINNCYILVKNYQHSASEIQIIPPGAKNSYGLDLRITFKPENLQGNHNETEVIEPQNFLEPIRECTEKLQAEIDEKIIDLDNEKYRLVNENDEKAHSLPDFDSKIQQLSINFEKLQKIYQNVSEYHNQKIIDQKARDYGDLEKTIEEIKEDLNELHMENTKISETFEEERRELAKFQVESLAEKRESIQIIKQDVQLLMSHKIKVIDVLMEIQNFMKMQVESLIN
ncbi:unnamed protein product [Blepharisma stoltei]|uniref:Kinetochore protein NDC80 n=1 Tax=Blepharisma stoltei TaxID=1481888 RepID=A0AAU9J8H5_9CILI|nr:unnamed protein product [Blepharisma stoltei]